MSVSAMKARFRDSPARVMTSVHRGLWGPLPENSLAAIAGAAAYDIVEIDLRLDADDRAYVMHDETFLRMTGQDIAADGADEEVFTGLRLRQGAGGDTPLTDQTIPTLEQAVSTISGTGAIFDYDVKRPEDVVAAARHLAELGAADTGTLKIDVFSPGDIAKLKAIEADFDVMVMAKVALKDDSDLETLRALVAADQAVAEVWYASLPLLEQAAAIGGDTMRLSVYTLDIVHCCGMADARALDAPDTVWGTLIESGVGQIMTDCPAELAKYLAARG